MCIFCSMSIMTMKYSYVILDCVFETLTTHSSSVEVLPACCSCRTNGRVRTRIKPAVDGVSTKNHSACAYMYRYIYMYCAHICNGIWLGIDIKQNILFNKMSRKY